MNRARVALTDHVERLALDIARSGVGMGLSQSLGRIAREIRRETESADREARRMIELMPVVMAEGVRSPLLAEGALLEWFDLMIKAEAMDRLLYRPEEERPGTGGRNGAEARWVVLDEIADWPEDGPVVRDGQTRGRTA